MATGFFTSRRVARRAGKGRGAALYVGAALLGLFVGGAILAPLITWHDPLTTNSAILNATPSWSHPLGTDYLGRDMLSRVLYGGRTTLLAVGIGVVGSAAIGIPLGLVAGYFRGPVEIVVVAVCDALLAIPSLVLALAIAFVLGPSVATISLALVVVKIPYFARITRGETIALKKRPFTELSVVAGCSAPRLLFKHLLPNMRTVLLVQAAVVGSHGILVTASLSFLGLGIPPPHPSWGGMLKKAVPYLEIAPWQAFVPGVVIFLAVLSFNLLADAKRGES